jgi:hypothetical protein
MFVWRMVRGHRAAKPWENTFGNIAGSRVDQEIGHLEQGHIAYMAAVDYILDELPHN